MSESIELGDATYNEIKQLCAIGDDFVNQAKYEEAITEYKKAWELVPEPACEWAASTWILAALGDAFFLSGYFTSAKEALEYAMHCPGATKNPFLHLRLGQVLFEKQDMDQAANVLIKAYMLAGDEIYRAENPKYLHFLKTRAIL